jgi:ribonuclease HI
MAKFYAVKAGRKPGIYESWDECEQQIRGFRRAKFRRFSDRSSAEKWLNPRQESAGELEEPGEMVNCWELDDETPHPDDSIEPLVIYTDGSAVQVDVGNHRRTIGAGCAIQFGSDDPRNCETVFPFPNPTNNRAELYACIRALEIVNEDKRIHPDTQIILCTDSSYVINCVTKWIYDWSRSNWRNGRIHNRTLIERLYYLAHERPVSFCKVAAHSGNERNNDADRMAKNASAAMPSVDSIVSDRRKYATFISAALRDSSRKNVRFDKR